MQSLLLILIFLSLAGCATFNLTSACSKFTSLISAKLYLFKYVPNGIVDPYTVPQLPNTANLRRISTDWYGNLATWNTKPSTASGSAKLLEDVIVIPGVTTPTTVLDNPIVDITAMAKRMMVPGANKGFELSMPDETGHYKARYFGSPNCPDLSKRPYIVFTY
eukprot:TRINITY_DN5937_c0_g1_i1.p1 TRINITY_DN5937_c0_g1~~TRINITY_DN5937_c0_g1_i1.p1  ORF type:complete len:163 (-),score=20.39 TRINITY_DN5937_c0_g1_i1:18-506(-)